MRTCNVFELMTLVMFTTNIIGAATINWVLVFAPLVLSVLMYGLAHTGKKES